MAFLNSKKPVQAGERHVCKVGSVKFKPRKKQTPHRPSADPTPDKAPDKAAGGPCLSHLDSFEALESEETLVAQMEAGPADSATPASSSVSSPTQFKKKKKRKKKGKRRTLQVF